MEAVKKFLRKMDFFGVNFAFKFNQKETYTTSLGGLFMVIFFIIGIVLGISNIFFFYKSSKFF